MSNSNNLDARFLTPPSESSDPAELEAWFGPGGFVEPFRKIRLSNCREIERAKAVAGELKVTESRLDDLAHLHADYVDFIIAGLSGRILRERNVLDSALR